MRAGLAALFLAGTLVGALFLCAEAALRAPGHPASWAELVRQLWLAYPLAGGLAAAGCLAAVELVRRLRGRRSPPGREARALALFLPLAIGLPLAYHANRYLLPAITSPRSLWFNLGAGVTLALAVLALGRWAPGRPALARALAPRRLVVANAAVAVAMTLALAVSPLVSPARDREEAEPTVGRGRPSVVVVLIDTLRADRLGAYGYPRPTSPVLDRLAGDGLLFERAYSQSAWTRPAIATLFTSLYPAQHRTNSWNQALPRQAISLAESLRAAGYRTGGFSANVNISPASGFAQGFDEFFLAADESVAAVMIGPQLWSHLRFRLGRGRAAVEDPWREDLEVVERAIAWLDSLAGEPFFLYVHLMAPHAPYLPPPAFREPALGTTVGDLPWRPPKTVPPGDEAEVLPAAELERMRALYDGEVRFADAQVGRLEAALAERGRWRDALVMITSDHGEEFYDHANWGHGHALYEELIRVPLIVKPPGTGGGVRVPGTVGLVDLYPSILAALGLPAPAGLAGVVVPLTDVEAAAGWRRDEAYAELLSVAYEIHALRHEGRKLIRTRMLGYRGEEWERAFDLRRDAGEATPLADAVTVVELSSRLEAYRSLAGPPLETEEVEVDERTRERLRALGYID